MAPHRDHSGRVVTVHDALNGTATTLKHVNYILDTSGAGSEPHPWCWTASTGHMRSVYTKQADLCQHMARLITQWVDDHPHESAENLAAMRQAAKEYKSAARSLANLSRKMRQAQSCLDATAE